MFSNSGVESLLKPMGSFDPVFDDDQTYTKRNKSPTGMDSISPDALSLDGSLLGSSSSDLALPSLLSASPPKQIDRSSTALEQQRKKAQEQLLLYQRMVEAEMKVKETKDFGNFKPRMNNSFKNSFIHNNQPDAFRVNQQFNNNFSHGLQGFSPGFGLVQSTALKHPMITGFIYQVQFKASSRYYILSPSASHVQSISVGEFVVVEADRGQDLGVVTALLTTQQFSEKRQHGLGMSAENSRVRRIVRPATFSERQALVDKHKDEQTVMQFCCQLSMTVHGLPISVYAAEYQFDRKKLTIYYDSVCRVDFRELVRDLYAAFKVRIWMEKINPQDEINSEAVVALATGVAFTH